MKQPSVQKTAFYAGYEWLNLTTQILHIWFAHILETVPTVFASLWILPPCFSSVIVDSLFWQRSLNCLERQKNPYNQCLTLWERRWFCLSKLVPWRKGSLDVERRRDARHITGAYVDCDRQCLQMNGHHSTSVSMGMITVDFSLMTRVVQKVIIPRILTKTQTAASNETSMCLQENTGRVRQK